MNHFSGHGGTKPHQPHHQQHSDQQLSAYFQRFLSCRTMLVPIPNLASSQSASFMMSVFRMTPTYSPSSTRIYTALGELADYSTFKTSDSASKKLWTDTIVLSTSSITGIALPSTSSCTWKDSLKVNRSKPHTDPAEPFLLRNHVRVQPS